MSPKIKRSDQDLLNSLKKNLKLLKEYSDKAFAQGDQKYLGEVAGKLRVLIHESRSNTPLLLSLMKKYQVDIPITINHPTGVINMSITEYLDYLAFAIRTDNQGLVKVSNKQLIAVWAEQLGAAHEDWSIEEEFSAALNSGVIIGNLPATSASLEAISHTVLSVGVKFIKSVESNQQANP